MNKRAITRASARFFGDTRGANMVEYILLVGVVALIAIGGFRLFGSRTNNVIRTQAASVGGINAAASGE